MMAPSSRRTAKLLLDAAQQAARSAALDRAADLRFGVIDSYDSGTGTATVIVAGATLYGIPCMGVPEAGDPAWLLHQGSTMVCIGPTGVGSGGGGGGGGGGPEDMVLAVPGYYPFIAEADSAAIKFWGAGGGGGDAGAGGGGGYVGCTVDLVVGDIYIVVVGSGGASGFPNAWTPSGTYGGGGRAHSSNSNYPGAGGGFTGLFHLDLTQADAVAIAAGGGGGGTPTYVGGAGGGTTGSNGTSPGGDGGTGGTPSAGGTGHGSGAVGSNGSALSGGNGASDWGGGGGGGYYGGGGGGEGSGWISGGGGGSSYTDSGTTSSVTNTGGSGATPGNDSDTDRLFDAGDGGAAGAYGGNGFAIISFGTPAPMPEVASRLWTPESAHPQNDEFRDGAIGSEWVYVDAASSANATWAEGGDCLSVLLNGGDDSGPALHAIMKPYALAVGEYVQCHIRHKGWQHNYPAAGLCIADGVSVGSGTQLIPMGIRAAGFSGISQAVWSGYQTRTSYSDNGDDRVWPDYHMRVLRDTSDVWRFWISADAVQWVALAVGPTRTLSLTPTHIGFAATNWGGGASAGAQFSFDYFRVGS